MLYCRWFVSIGQRNGFYVYRLLLLLLYVLASQTSGQPPALRWPDAPARTDPTSGVYAAHGLQTNLCLVIHTLNTADGEVPAKMVVVRLALGIAPDARRSTPGGFTSDECSHFLKMLGGALLPAKAQRSTP